MVGAIALAGLGVGIVGDVHVQAVGGPSPGGGHVEDLAAGGGADQGVGGVGGAPLHAVSGGGVGQLDMLDLLRGCVPPFVSKQNARLPRPEL